MTTATLTTRGQVTVPAAVRVAMGLQPGSRVEFVETAPGQFSIIAASNSVRALKGILRKPQHPVSLKDMDAAIAAEGGAFDDRP